MSDKYASMTDAQLAAAEADLAQKRTAIRLEQNACSAEIELRRKINEMSGAAREALLLRLGGGIGTAGATNVKAPEGAED